MENKFYREKNALSISGAKIVTPSKEELENLLLCKLEEKSKHMGVIHNKALRDEYLEKKGKLEESKNMSTEEVEKNLALRLSADILQLTLDLGKLYRARVVIENTEKTNISTADIEKELLWCCEKLRTKTHKDKILDVLIHLIYAYIDDFGITIEDTKAECKKIEEVEGNFFNGKIVKVS